MTEAKVLWVCESCHRAWGSIVSVLQGKTFHVCKDCAECREGNND